MQFLAFLGLAAGFFFLNGILIRFMFSDLAVALADKQATISPALMVQYKWAQVLFFVISFIIPALLFGYYSSPKALPYVGIRKHVSSLLLLVSIVLLVVVQFFVGWLGELNSKINFGSIQKMMQEAEANYNRMISAFLNMRSIADLFVNLLIMALLPAIAEELFFRGALQKAFLRMSNRPWLAILVSTIIFTMLHGTIFKFLPIFALGLMLGTVYHVTRNLWYTITIHFFNNAIGVLAAYYSSKVPWLQKMANDDVSVKWYAAIGSLVLTIGIINFMAQKSNEVLPAHVVDEDNDYIA